MTLLILKLNSTRNAIMEPEGCEGTRAARDRQSWGDRGKDRERLVCAPAREPPIDPGYLVSFATGLLLVEWDREE